jgi:fatty acid desaturase
MSYFHDVKDHATYLMVLAGASIVTMLLQWYLLLWITGLACLGLIGLDFYSVQQHLAEEMQNGQNPLAALARMDWGWAVLFAGSAMLIVAAAMWKEERSPARNENAPRSAPQQ